MNKGQSSKRLRGHRGNGRRPNGGRNANFESSGPQGKIRGTAYQVIEKYQALGRDALTFGDRVAAENFFQHAEHYYRVMAANGGADQQRGGRNSGAQQNRQTAGEEQQPRTQDLQEAGAETAAEAGAPSAASAEAAGDSEPPAKAEEAAMKAPEAEVPTA